MCVILVFCVIFLLLDGYWWSVVLPDDSWTLWCCQDYATARRWWTASSGSSETWCVPERSQSTMEKLPGDWRVHQEQGQGRSQMTTSKPDSLHILLFLRNRIGTAWALEIDFRRATEVHLPDQTVSNKPHCDGTRVRRPARCAVITTHRCVVRFNFAGELHNWQIRHWRPILFTDVSSFTESPNDRRVRVWKPQGEVYAYCNIVKVDWYDGGSSWSGLICP